MIQKFTAYILCCYFLSGSIILPLGDFALMKDLPQMYCAYKKLATPQEQGIIDFVGDYLMGGRILLGHNKNDNPETTKSNVQYQHTASFCSMINIHFQPVVIKVADTFATHNPIQGTFYTSEFHQ